MFVHAQSISAAIRTSGSTLYERTIVHGLKIINECKDVLMAH